MPIDPNRETWKPGMPWEKALEDIDYITALGQEMGGAERIKRQHSGGRYTVRERVNKMLDKGSFVEYGPMIGAAEYDDDGIVEELFLFEFLQDYAHAPVHVGDRVQVSSPLLVGSLVLGEVGRRNNFIRLGILNVLLFPPPFDALGAIGSKIVYVILGFRGIHL